MALLYVNLVCYYNIRLRIQLFLLAPRRQGHFLLAICVSHLAARSYEKRLYLQATTISNPQCSVKK